MELIKLLFLMGLSVNDAYAATAIATCESGDTVTFGTYDWTARSATNDGGAFQFNDATWEWLVGYGRGDTVTPVRQVAAFDLLYRSGQGITHWSASRPCWSKWIDNEGRAVNPEHYNEFSLRYLALAFRDSNTKGAKQ